MQNLLEQTSRWRPCLESTSLTHFQTRRPAKSRRQSSLEVKAITAKKEVPTWQMLSASAGASALEGYSINKKAVPRSTPSPTLPTEPDAETGKPVLL